jgi:hypothetical protein
MLSGCECALESTPEKAHPPRLRAIEQAGRRSSQIALLGQLGLQGAQRFGQLRDALAFDRP